LRLDSACAAATISFSREGEREGGREGGGGVEDVEGERREGGRGRTSFKGVVGNGDPGEGPWGL